ncbi:MAG: oligosaccharide flippase family protein [Cetobacterium sp.]
MLNNILLRNGLLYTIGGVLLQGVNFFTLPIFTRLLNVESFGIVSIYNTWLSILAIFICFQSYGSIGNAKINYTEEEFREYILNIVLLSTVIFVLWILIFFIFQEKISQKINISINLIYVMLLQSFFNTIIVLKTTIYIYEQKVKEKLIVSFINIFFNVVFSILLIKYLYIQKTYIGRIIGGAVPTILLGLFYYIEILKRNLIKVKIKYWKFCLTLTIPLVFHGLSGIVLSSADRLMLEKFKGFYETGIYSFIYNFGMIISMIWGALNSAWIPWYYENLKDKNEQKIKKYSINYLYIFTMLSIGFLMISPEIIKMMAPSKYWKGLNFFPLILLGNYFVFLYSFSVNYEFYCKKTKYIAIATTSAAIINFLLNIYFIPRYGGIGAASTTLIAYFCMFLFHEMITRLKLKYSILKKSCYIKEIVKVCFFIIIYYLFLENLLLRVGLLILYVVITIKKNIRI